MPITIQKITLYFRIGDRFKDRFRDKFLALVFPSFILGFASFILLPAQAAPNGLTQIPIAKVFGDGVAAFSVARVAQQSQTTTYTTQYGINNRFEVGLDYQAAPSDQRTVLGNVKYLMVHSPGHLPDIACGITNVATGQKALPYLVATTQPKATGLSLGVIRPGGGAYFGMAGVSYSITPSLQLVSDEIEGRSNYATFGVIVNVTKTISLNLAYASPQNPGSQSAGSQNADHGVNPRGFVLNLAYVFHLSSGKKSPTPSGAGSKNPAPGGGGH